MNGLGNLGIRHAGAVEVANTLGPDAHGADGTKYRNRCQRHFVTAFRRNQAMENIGERVRRLREERGIERPDLARAAGLSYSMLADLENGKAKTTTRLHRIADRLGVRVHYLETGDGPEEAIPTPEAFLDWAPVHATRQGLGLGQGVDPEDYAEAHLLLFRKSSLARKHLKPDKLEVAYGKGESMLPRIHDGDAVLFDTTDTTPKDGHLYVILVEGRGDKPEPQVKRCLTIGSFVFFAADNPAGAHDWAKPRPLGDPKHEIRVLGRVRWIGSWEG